MVIKIFATNYFTFSLLLSIIFTLTFENDIYYQLKFGNSDIFIRAILKFDNSGIFIRAILKFECLHLIIV